MFSDEITRCFGVIILGVDRVFGATFSSEIGDRKFATLIIYCVTTACVGIETRAGTDGIIFNTSRALLRVGRTLEKAKFKETAIIETFYASLKCEFGMIVL